MSVADALAAGTANAKITTSLQARIPASHPLPDDAVGTL
jgi:hypothetical protein